MEFIAALATDDGKTFVTRHFGDAECYHLFALDQSGARFLKVITNTVPEEDSHADPRKAGGIAALLKAEKVNVLATRVFGPNIKRVRKKFVCVVLSCHDIPDGTAFLCAHLDAIRTEWEKGEDRMHLNQRTMA